jgi:hypothetical protein
MPGVSALIPIPSAAIDPTAEKSECPKCPRAPISCLQPGRCARPVTRPGGTAAAGSASIARCAIFARRKRARQSTWARRNKNARSVGREAVFKVALSPQIEGGRRRCSSAASSNAILARPSELNPSGCVLGFLDRTGFTERFCGSGFGDLVSPDIAASPLLETSRWCCSNSARSRRIAAQEGSGSPDASGSAPARTWSIKFLVCGDLLVAVERQSRDQLFHHPCRWLEALRGNPAAIGVTE